MAGIYSKSPTQMSAIYYSHHMLPSAPYRNPHSSVLRLQLFIDFYSSLEFVLLLRVYQLQLSPPLPRLPITHTILISPSQI